MTDMTWQNSHKKKYNLNRTLSIKGTESIFINLLKYKDVFHTHDVIDNAENALFDRLGVRATIHLDPIVIDDERVNALREKTAAAVKKIDERLSIHDFRFVEGTTHTNLIFDVVAPFELKMSNGDLKHAVADKISELDPNYFVVVTIDRE